MATLINGNGNPRIYAAQDADLIAALAGDITGIAQIGNKFAATAVDANTISVADGVIITKEGRRIQLDAGSTDMFVIPTGTTGVTNYYIIGYKLTTQSDDSQIAETFVQLMSSSSETITEDTFRAGATDVYVSLYRVQQNGVNLGTITGLLPELTNISELKSDLADMMLHIGFEYNAISYSSAWGFASDLMLTHYMITINSNYQAGLNPMPSGTTIGTIATEFRPAHVCYYPCTVADENFDYLHNGIIRISTSGNITYYGNSVPFKGFVLFVASYAKASQ